MKIGSCPISGTGDSIKFIDLGEVPLVNNLCETREASLHCEKFPLVVQLFTKSRLSCLTEIVDKDKLFLNYVYQSGVNKPFITHCAGMYDYLERYLSADLPFGRGNIIIDVGGNDGSLLKEFRRINPNPEYINIDASRSFIEMNESAGIRYINKFFDKEFYLAGGADLMISTNVFQHTFDIRSFVRGIYNCLNKDGVWCLEFPYLLTTLLNDNYDQIYHEHIYYYLLQNIVDLLAQENMRVINVSFHDIHSGTIRVISVKVSDPRQSDHSIDSFLNLEKTLTDEYYVLWGKRTIEKIIHFREFIEELYFGGSSIACFGAAAKGCVFLNTCGLDYNKIRYIIDDTPFKQGKFVPGTGLEVVSRDILKKEKVDYLIILAHNFKDYIIASLRNEYQGKFIIMFPDIKVI
jgi:novobiocin biosynthesis protein NovU/D-mycarose 3-C-methyltransferase